MEIEEQIRRYKNSIAKSFASLTIGLLSVSVIGYQTSAPSWATYSLVALGAVSGLFGAYLRVPYNWRQKSVLEYLETKKTVSIVEALVWLIVFALFGVRLLQTKVFWLILTGLTTEIIAFIVFYGGLLKMVTTRGNPHNKKEVKTMGNKGRSNVKKPKQSKEKKQEKQEAKKK